VITLRNRKLLPLGFGATGSIWRVKPRHKFVAAVACATRANRAATTGERVYLEVRSSVPIGKVRFR
jgi:hypothetical protein